MNTEQIRQWACKQLKCENIAIITVFPVLYQDWEGDGVGWIVCDGIKNHVILTSHGGPYFSTKIELKSLMETYKNVYDCTEEAIQILGE